MIRNKVIPVALIYNYTLINIDGDKGFNMIRDKVIPVATKVRALIKHRYLWYFIFRVKGQRPRLLTFTKRQKYSLQHSL